MIMVTGASAPLTGCSGQQPNFRVFTGIAGYASGSQVEHQVLSAAA